MEGELSSLEIHTPVFDKKKKKYSVYKEGQLRHVHESVRDSPLASEQSHVTKSKKKRKDCQHLLPSPLKKSEVCDSVSGAQRKLGSLLLWFRLGQGEACTRALLLGAPGAHVPPMFSTLPLPIFMTQLSRLVFM